MSTAGGAAARRGSLTVVGTGIRFRSHMTLESLEAIQRAQKVLFVTADVMTERWLHELNASAEHMPTYLPDRPRRDTYELWVGMVLDAVRGGLDVAAVTYGHPGVLVWFTREAIRRARAEGFEARMLPGIGTDAVLVCDLLVDPGDRGLQSYPASRFLQRRPRFDPGVPLLLWQITVIDQPGPPTNMNRPGLERLAARLLEHYPATHAVTVYEASRNEVIDPVLQTLPLARLAEARTRVGASLYLPPLPG